MISMWKCMYCFLKKQPTNYYFTNIFLLISFFFFYFFFFPQSVEFLQNHGAEAIYASLVNGDSTVEEAVERFGFKLIF
jgi:hypothetical protein